jgi:LacI family transcriptional regulator, galactose operon repressor
MRVNQNQLAKQLRLSRTTVSRSLSNHPAIAAETRSRVQSLAAQLGYRGAPTRAVRRPRDAKPIAIGVLIGASLVDADRATFPALLRGIRHRAAIEHAAIDVASIDPADLGSEGAQRQVFRLIRGSHWRGALLIYPFPGPLVQALAKKISLVSVLTEYRDHSIDVVDTDHQGVGLLVGQLVEHGHRRIGFVSWHYPVGGLWASRRFGAFAESIYQHGLALDSRFVFNVGSVTPTLTKPEQIADAVCAAVKRDRVTAWVCAADHQAFRLISDLRTRGIRVPEDCSVTGFDGNAVPPGLPSLTTLHVSNEQIGEASVAQLISRLLYPRSGRRKIFVETALQTGASVAPARP